MHKVSDEKRTQQRTRLLASTLLCGAAMLASASAMAQDATTEMEAIVVTGSRLVRTDLTAPSPLTVVGADDIAMSGNVTIENTMNEFPQLAAGNTSSVNNGGDAGVLTANLRGLGATRTLVLVNGRRFMPANSDGSVDLATIPDALVERVDIITGGASAVYGSDAIAGAINFVLKDDFEGLETSYQYGETFEGDGAAHKFDVTFGSNFADDRGNVVVSASYTKRDEVMQAARDFSRVPLDTVNGQLMPGGSGSIPGTRIPLSESQRDSLVGVDLTPNGECTSITGIRFGENAAVMPYCQPQDAYNYASDNYLQRPMERTQVSALGKYDLTDHIQAYAELYFVNTTNSYQQAPDSFTPLTPGAASSTLLLPNYATSASLPASLRQFFVDNAAIFDPDGDGTAAIEGAGRRADELGTRYYSYERTSFNLTGGLRGDFSVGSTDWNWDAFYQYQRNRTDTRIEGQISQTRLSLGLDSIVDANGNVVCRVNTLGCVPVNIFGLGSISEEAGAYLTPTRAHTEVFERQVAGASISGAPIELPAGPLAVALGVEYRKDKYDFSPSAMDLGNEYGPVSLRPMGGDVDLKEVFGEMRIPLLDAMPFADTLAIEAAARYGDYSSVGSVFTWKVGGEYAPVDWIRLRTAYNSAIRAPTLNELYSSISRGFNSGSDPCAADQNPTAAQQQMCVAQGVPAADLDSFTQATLGYTVEGGGNPNLKEEKSKTITVGAVISPPVVPGLNFTIDYFKVKVDDAITSINGNQTLADCFSTLDPNSETCKSIHRLASGQLDYVSTQLKNIGSLKVEGLDVQTDYRFDLPEALALGDDLASVSLQAVASWLFERSTQVLAGQEAVDCAGKMGGGCTGIGIFAVPDFKLLLGATYTSGPLNWRLQGRMIGGLKLYEGVTSPVEKTSAQWYFDTSVSYDVTDGLQLYGGIDNLFNNKPPIMGTALAGDANTDPSLYDVIGRRFFVGARARF
ncbi:TonB-dependent receptor plug domain-containing protein [Pedomonas mirosovicensis]|uniref:TonB-dependent receptor plug domain-containing protein n=1 Tax=Pedomonas mirosovicensis TaxID=2908641 RepID=UPI00216A35F1|nr:TonB-dependent receptor [Pedomonas mirosovicensis]MCH8686580.1 TonB-dependent receptor [Pedomonas mirosovicensis]